MQGVLKKFAISCLALFFVTGAIAWAEDSQLSLEQQKKIVETARWLFNRKEYDLAEKTLKNTLSTPGMDRAVRSQSQLLLAGIAQERGQDAESLAYLLGWLDEYPGMKETARVNYKIGTMFRNLKAYGRAEEYFSRSLSAAVATASSESGRESISSYQRLAIAAKWELGETRYQAQEWKRSFDLFERFVKQNPEADDLVQASYYRMGDCRYQLGETDAAIREYKNALSIGPLHPFAPEAWLRLVDLYGKKGQFDEQAAALHSLIWLAKEAHPKDIEYWQQRTADILLLIVQSRPADAQKLLTALNREQSNPQWAPIAEFLKGLTGRVVDSFNAGKIKKAVVPKTEKEPDPAKPATAGTSAPLQASASESQQAATPPPVPAPATEQKLPAPQVNSEAPTQQPSPAAKYADDWELWKKQLDETNLALEKRIRALK